MACETKDDGQEVDLGDILLKPAYTLRGGVILTDGRPVPPDISTRRPSGFPSCKAPSGLGRKNVTVETPVSLLDIAPTVCEAAGVEPLDRLDGISLNGSLKGDPIPAGRELMFQTGWQITGNPACGIQRWEPSGRHHLFVYNLASASDELYDLNDPDAQNLAHRPEHAEVRTEMTRRMFELIRKDPRWGCYGAEFQMHHYFDLHRTA